MTPTADDTALRAAVTEMIGEAKKLRTEVSTVAKAGKRNRRMIWVTIASVVLDVVISFGLGWNIHKTNKTSDKTDAVASTKTDVCLALNDQNVVQLDLWKTLLGFKPPVDETPEQKAVREARTVEFQAALDKAFAPIDCAIEP